MNTNTAWDKFSAIISADSNFANMGGVIGTVGHYTGLTSYMQGATCQSDKRLKGQTVAITGANTGIGFETAKDLCKRGARVLMLSRNVSKGTEAASKIMEEMKYHSDSGNVVFMKLDLASLASVRACAEKISQQVKNL